RPYRAGALREPPRCGREYPNSGWGHWDPPRGSRGPMDPSQRQLVTWFSPRDHTGLTLLGNHPRATGNLLEVAGATWDRPRGSRGPRTHPEAAKNVDPIQIRWCPLGPSRDHTGLTLLGNHPRATGNLLEVAGATWDPPRGSRGPRDPPRGSQGPWSYPDKVVPPGTLQRPYRAGALREPPRCGREHPSSGWGHWDPPRGSRGPMDPIPEAAGDLVLTQRPYRADALREPPTCDREPLRSGQGHLGPTQGQQRPHGPTQRQPGTCVGDPSKGGWDSLDPPMDGGLPLNHRMDCGGPRKPHRGGRALATSPRSDDCTKDPPRGGGGPQYLSRCDSAPRDPPRRPYRAGALREPPRCGREHPSSGWGHWDPPKGSRGPMDPSQRQLVTWFSPRDHTGLALSGNLQGAAGNIQVVVGAIGTHPEAAEAPWTQSQRQLVTWFSPRDHIGLTLLGNHPRATGNVLGVARATWDPPRGSRGPMDPPRGSQGRWSYPDKVMPPGTLQRPYRAGALREPPRCGREHPRSGWGPWDSPRGSRGPRDPSQRQLVTWFSPRDHTGLTLLGNHPRATGNLLGVAGATWDPPRGSRGPRDPPRGSQGPWSYPDKVVPPGTLQRPYRAGALREPPRCGREHPSSGWGHWDPPRGSRGPMDPSQRQLVTWFSPRDHTGLTLLGDHPRATGNLLGVAGATWDPPRGSRGPMDPPRGSQGPWSYPDKVVPPGTLQVHRMLIIQKCDDGHVFASPKLSSLKQSSEATYKTRHLRGTSKNMTRNIKDHIGLTLLGNHPRATGNLLGVARATWDPPRGSRGPMDPPRGSQGRWSYPDKVMPPGTLQRPYRAGALGEPPRCGREHPSSGWGHWDPPKGSRGPMDPSQRQLVTWFSPRAGALGEPPRCGREHPSSGWGHWDPPKGSRGPMDPSQRQLVTWFSPRDHTGLTLLGNHPRATGNLLEVAGATWDPPRGSRGPRDPPRGSQGPWSYPDKVVPPGTLQRPYRAGALREPPRCGREHPSSGWGHWDPPRGSRGPMDPSQRQLVTWFSPRCVGDPSKGGWDSLDPPMDGGPHWNHRMDCGGPRKPHRGGRAPATPPRSDDCTKDPPRGGGGPQYLSRDHTGLMLLGNHPRATGNLLGVAGATWDPPRGSRGPRDPPRGSQERGSYPDKVVAPGTLQVRRAGALREPPRCGRKHPRSGWGPWDPPRGSRGPRDPSQRQLVTWFSPRDHTGLTLLGNHPRATGNLLGVAGATWDRPRGSRGPRDPPRGSQERGSYPDKVVPLGPSRDHTGQALSGNLQGAAGNILGVAGATWDSPRGSRGPRDPSQRQLVNCFSPRNPHRGGRAPATFPEAARVLRILPGAVEARSSFPETIQGRRSQGTSKVRQGTS
ncbi:collagen alpha-2(V) chain-like, partial [Homarus americanus]|uniref:collagen alpha-2(V) chain-like n=1 Tax=Homarus americanus TaxID=6706 RepID=UPI001C46A3D9